jgi:hypothetical protein
MSHKSVQRFCDNDMSQRGVMSRKSVQRFCDNDMDEKS